jgi:hypothetical protein
MARLRGVGIATTLTPGVEGGREGGREGPEEEEEEEE